MILIFKLINATNVFFKVWLMHHSLNRVNAEQRGR